MDNRPKHPNKRMLGAVDGMLSKPVQMHGVKRVSPHTPVNAKNQDITFAGRTRLDNFNLADGFHPAKQPTIEHTSQRITPGTTDPTARPLERQPRRRPDGTIDLTLTDGIPKPKKKRFRFSLRPTKKRVLILLILIMLLAGGIFGKSWYRLHQVFKGGGLSAILRDNVNPSQLNGEGDGRVNILLLGKGGDGHDGPDLTDTILIASIDPLNKKAALLSIPRDLWVSTSGGGHTKINSIYANAKYKVLNGKKINNQQAEAEKAGLAAIDNEISQDMGIPIHYHVMVDFNGFQKAIDTVGGIDINITPENAVHEVMYDESTHKTYILDVKTGQQHFDGTRALFYSRSRHTSPRGDFDRTERQRLVLEALKYKVLTAGTFANPNKVSGLLDAFGQHVQSNLSLNEVMRLYDIAKTLSSDSIASLGLADPPNNFVQTDNIDGLSIVRPRAGIDNYTAIQNYVRNALKDGFIANENAKILILNGTSTEGLATKKSDELKSYGYNVLTVGTAPTQTYTKTVLVDLRNGSKKYTQHYLEQRLGVSAISSLPDPKIIPGDADFVIILGSN